MGYQPISAASPHPSRLDIQVFGARPLASPKHQKIEKKTYKVGPEPSYKWSYTPINGRKYMCNRG